MTRGTLQLLEPPFLRLDYRLPAGTGAGQLYWAPLGGRWTVGMAVSSSADAPPARSLRDAVPIPVPPLPSWLQTLLQDLPHTPEAFRRTLPGALLPPDLPRGPLRYLRLRAHPAAFHPRGHRQRALVALFARAGRRWMRMERLQKRLGVSRTWLEDRVSRGWLEEQLRWPEVPRGRLRIQPHPVSPPAQPCDAASPSSVTGKIHAFPALPYAVREACVRTWMTQHPVLVLVPDEGLLRRWQEALPELVPFSSSLPSSHRQAVWWGVREGRIRGVVGTQAALWLPFAAPPLWVADEPWMDPFRDPPLSVWDTRAETVRVFFSGIPFETLQRGRWAFASEFPTLRPWTVREVPYGKEAALQALIREVKRGLRLGGQVAVWVARRGVGWVQCEACGYAPLCPACNHVLVLHHTHSRYELYCHRCGQRATPPERCPACGGETWRVQGVGTQRVQEVLQQALQERVLRLDRDVRHRRKGVDERWRRKEARVLVGTWAARDALVAPDVRTRILFLPERHLVGGLEDERRWLTRILWMDAVRGWNAPVIQRVILTHRADFPVFQAVRRGDVPGYLRFLYRVWRRLQDDEPEATARSS